MTSASVDRTWRPRRCGRIVDRLEYYVNPVVVGGGKPWLPQGLHLDLRLVEQQPFGNGVVHLAWTTGRRAQHR